MRNHLDLNGAILKAPSGRVELGGLTEAGNVQINIDNNNLSLSFPNQENRANVQLSQGAEINVASLGKGDIAINGNNINILGKSSLLAGNSFVSFGNIPAGNIQLMATGDVNIIDSSIINGTFGRGNGGNINISGRNITVENGLVAVGTMSQSNAGSLDIKAQDSLIVRNVPDNSGSNNFAINVRLPVNFSTNLNEVGNLNILPGLKDVVDSLNKSGAFFGINPNTINYQISTLNLPINTGINSFSFDGNTFFNNFIQSPQLGQNNQLVNFIKTLVPASGGDAGDIFINARNLSLKDGGAIGIATLGQGRPGDLNFQVSSEFKAENSAIYVLGLNRKFNNSNNTARTQISKRGNISINTEKFTAQDSMIGVGNFSETPTGNLTINAKDIVEIFASENSNGTFVANIPFINFAPIPIGLFAGSLSLSEIFPRQISQDQSQIFVAEETSQPELENSGQLVINTGRLLVRDGAVVSAGTGGREQGGDLIVNAKSVEISGTSRNGGFGPFEFANQVPSGLINTTSGFGPGGKLTVNTEQLIVKDGAWLAGNNRGFGNQRGGTVTINARGGSVIVSGTSQNGIPSLIITGTASGNSTTAGDAGDLKIDTDSLVVNGGGLISAATLIGNGKGGNVTITSQSIQLDGSSRILLSKQFYEDLENYDRNLNPTEAGSAASLISKLLSGGFIPSGIISGTSSNADAGNIDITTQKLSITNGAQASVFTLAKGNAGNLNITANTIELDGKIREVILSPEQLLEQRISTSGLVYGPSLLSTAVSPNATGRGGDLTVKTNSLSITNSARISAESAGNGNAGDININAASSVRLNGGKSGLFASSTGRGSAGNLTIETNNLFVEDAGEAAVNSKSGQAGNLTATANRIYLNRGNLTAITGQGSNGGNINLNGLELLFMQNNSLISAEALDNANGGNVFINSPDGFIIAIPKENNDIIAVANRGNGGNIDITTSAIYGLQERRGVLDPKISEINASSQFGLDGTILINTPDTEPKSDLVNLPSVPVDTRISQGCYGANQSENRFVNTGRSGLPPNPKDVLTSDTLDVVNWVTIKPSQENSPMPSVSKKNTNSTPEKIVEATGWIVNDKGQVVFVADSASTGYNSWQNQNINQCQKF